MKEDRFFGFHYDFHADSKHELGTRMDKDDIENIIKECHLDYIQCDCKGHPGITSYPTKVGVRAEKIKNDPLRCWVDAAKKCGVPIYMHYSGVVDAAYCKSHPENSLNYADDENDTRINVFYKEYLDNLMIPQLKELIDEYGIDGVWVDGDCWTLTREVKGRKFSDTMLKIIDENTTMDEYANIFREGFRKYLKKYVDELHEYKPDFKIISNWAYSSMMPEKPEINLDYLSGDVFEQFPALDSRYQGRCMAAQGIPWELMNWSYSMNTETFLPLRQLCRDAAAVISLGGGACTYIHQNDDGSMKQILGDKFVKLSEFINKRRFNYNKKMIAQIGIFYSAETKYANGNMFQKVGETNCIIGMTNAINDVQFTNKIILEHQTDTFSEYESIIVPEWEKISDEIKDKFAAYANAGGKLIIVGAELTSQIGNIIGRSFEVIEEGNKHIMDSNGDFAKIKGKIAKMTGGNSLFYDNSDKRDLSKWNSSLKIEHGKGCIVFIPFDLGTMYEAEPSTVLRDYLYDVLTKDMTPFVQINKKGADITLIDDNDGMIVNLINMTINIISPKQITHSEISPINDIELKINGKFSKVSSLVDDELLAEIYDDYAVVKVNKLDLHTAFRLEYKK